MLRGLASIDTDERRSQLDPALEPALAPSLPVSRPGLLLDHPAAGPPGAILVATMRIPPLLRTILVLAAGLSAALYAIHEPEIPESNPGWIPEDPDGTRGCPGLERQLVTWRRELALPDWRIEIRCGLAVPGRENLLGRVLELPERRWALISIREGLSLEVQQSVLVHELVHVGVSAGRWWVPDGRGEEEFVFELSLRLYVGMCRRVERSMLQDFRRAARARQRAADNGS